jgi:hypothetical protein
MVLQNLDIRDVFPAPTTIVLGNGVCVKNVAVFARFSLAFRDPKLRKRHAAGKTELPKITRQLPQTTTIFTAKKDTKDIMI